MKTARAALISAGLLLGVVNGISHYFDRLECAISPLAPECELCGCKIIGHGLEAGGNFYCCGHCAHEEGGTAIHDRAWLLNFAVRHFSLPFLPPAFKLQSVTAETFAREMAEAMKTYENYIVCIGKTPDEFQLTLASLLGKAIKAYETRGPQLRHGIALDRYVTVILSQSDATRPLCGIYFNLHSPYQKPAQSKPGKSLAEPVGGTEG